MARALKFSAAADSRAIDSSSVTAVTGSITLSSRNEPVWANATVASLPTTRATTIVRLSTITGLTLPGMMLDPGWVSGSASSARPARGPIPISRTSEAIFQSDSAIVRSAAVGGDRHVERGLGVEVVRGLADVEAGQAGESGTRPERELGVGIDAGPDRRAAERHRQQLGLGGARPADRFLDLAGVAAELLPEPDRRGVLEVRPAGLDHRPEGLLAGDEGGVESFERREQLLLDRDRRRELERGRDDVVRRLAAVDVVVRVDLAAAEAVRGEVRDDLVHVRVGRGARAGLVDVDREVVVVAALGDLGGGRGDRLGDGSFEEAELGVRLGRGLLDLGERPQEAAREALAGDREVEDGPLGRGAVQGVGRDLELAHGVLLDAGAGRVGHRVDATRVGGGPAWRAPGPRRLRLVIESARTRTPDDSDCSLGTWARTAVRIR